jgi:VWFA-related protein
VSVPHGTRHGSIVQCGERKTIEPWELLVKINKYFPLRDLLCELLAAALVALACAPTLAQQPQKPPTDDVLRINTELVQTAITVVDKGGHFVDGLTRDQFALLVGGKPRPISFFERVTAGSAREAQLSMRADVAPPAAQPPAPAATLRGRTIVFFIDDMHLSPDSLHRTREMLRHFLDNEMSPRDSVAIASASGQVGFLQQYTRNREVLKAAIERLSPIPYDVRGYGTGSTKMSEYLALDIDTRKSDDKVLKVYVEECMKQTQTFQLPPSALVALRATCETEVKNSARAILIQAGTITQNMYASLDSLLRSSARAPGRKLAFFVSDGFLMDAGPHGPGLRDKLDRLIDSAQRAGVVIYTIHAKGLVTSFPDASTKTPVDERLDIAQAGEVEATQDALNGLAEDTGGRALRNTNYFDRWVGKVLDETSNYYLLAWRPEKDEETVPKFRGVTIKIVNRPELTVRAPRGYVEGPPATVAIEASEKTNANHTATTAEAELRNALADYYPSNSLPTLLSLTYLNTPKNEMLLTSSIQVGSSALSYGSDGKQKATVKLAGVILNDKGKIASSFRNQLNVNPLDGQSLDAGVIYNQHTPMAPGIYQVRVAARDEASGRVGSAMEWIVIPDLTKRELTLSSVLLGGQVLENKSSKDGNAQVQLSVDHRFVRSSHLGYWIFIYNARRDGAGAPSLTVQSQVLRGGQVVLAGAQRKISSASPDPERIPFGDELMLRNLSPGRYDLTVTITDSVAGTSATQTIDFEVL